MKASPMLLVLPAIFASAPARALADEQTPLLRTLAECRARPDTQRLACYDERIAVFMQAERAGDVVVMDRDQVRTSKRASFGLGSGASSALPSNEGMPAQIEAKIRTVSDLGRGRWEFTLDNGMRWRQTDDEVIFPRAGQPVTIRTAAMGSYLLKLPSRSVRVIRVR